MRYERLLDLGAIAALAASLLGARHSNAESLVVAVSPDIPPYVMKGATSGLEIDLLRAALPDHDLRFVQLPYEALQTAVGDGQAAVSVGVQADGADGVHYSLDCVAFVNFAISHREDGLTIDGVDDLAGHRVLTWQGADRELGAAFAQRFGPGGPSRKDYVEVADQSEQVRRFWASRGDVIIIDGSIFRHDSAAQGHDLDDVVFHAIFPTHTDFKVAFADAALRDRFDAQLLDLCASGRYAAIAARYGMEPPKVLCARMQVMAAVDAWYRALDAIFAGDVAPMAEAWSHADDVTMMGPDGAIEVGWPAVLADWRRQADMKLGGHGEPRDARVHVGRDLAVVVHRSVGANEANGETRPFDLRVTFVFRREHGAWKMITMQTDELAFLK